MYFISCIFLLQLIASHFEWIHTILNNLGRDGKEAIWRTISEGSHPETVIIGLKYCYSHHHYLINLS